MRKRILVLITLVLIAVALPLLAGAETSGTCGDNLTWTLDDDGLLTISGTGKMSSFTSNWYVNSSPWGNSVTSVIILPGVTEIGKGAFNYCERLTSATIPDSVTCINSFAFRGCVNLVDAPIPDSVTVLGEECFWGCDNLKDLTIPLNVTSIGKHAFFRCRRMISATIPYGVPSIEQGAFGYCSSLIDVTIPDSVTSIAYAAFDACISLTSVVIPESVTDIAYRGFYDCKNLTSVTILNKDATINEGNFKENVNEVKKELTIYGYTGSTAEAYANENGIKFIPLDGTGTNMEKAILYVESDASVSLNERYDDYLPCTININVRTDGFTHAEDLVCSIDLPEELLFDNSCKATITSSGRFYCEEEEVAFVHSQKAGNIPIGSIDLDERKDISIEFRVKKLYDQDLTTQIHVSLSGLNIDSYSFTKELKISGWIPVFENRDTKIGPFKYGGNMNQIQDSTATYYYSDKYFDGDSRKINPSLATMSLCLELSTWSSFNTSVWEKKTQNIQQLFKEIGFKDYDQNDYWKKEPSMHSIGLAVARKNIGDYTVVALAVRGGGYEAEWGGNFVLGTNGDHKGFKLAVDDAFLFLNNYVIEHKSVFKDKLKLWIVGYSRGGAVANMVAGKLNEKPMKCGGMDLSKENIFAYTFEAPQGFFGITTYENIHNFINDMDIVPRVGPSVWGFHRYNTSFTPIMQSLEISDDEYDNRLKEIKAQYEKVVGGVPKYGITMEEEKINYEPNQYSMRFSIKSDISMAEATWLANDVYNDIYVGNVSSPGWNLYNYQYRIETYRDMSLPVGQMLEKNIESIFNGIPNGRTGYVNTIEKPLSELASFFGAHNTIDWSSAVHDAFFSPEYQGAIKIYQIMIGLSKPSVKVARAAAKAVELIGSAALKQTGTDLTVKEVLSGVESALAALFNDFVDDPEQLFGFIYYLTADNGIQAHWPEVTLAAMMASDPNYSDKPIHLNDSAQSYPVVMVACPVDVMVYDENNQLMSQIRGKSVTNTSTLHGIYICKLSSLQK